MPSPLHKPSLPLEPPNPNLYAQPTASVFSLKILPLPNPLKFLNSELVFLLIDPQNCAAELCPHISRHLALAPLRKQTVTSRGHQEMASLKQTHQACQIGACVVANTDGRSRLCAQSLRTPKPLSPPLKAPLSLNGTCSVSLGCDL